MKRLIIICEGPTEVEFCRDVLCPHFLKLNIHVQTPLIKKSGGGIVPWNALYKQIFTHLNEPNVIVTTLIDYYGIPDRHLYPNWIDAKTIINKLDRMSFLEQSMKAEIPDTYIHRFIPYLQLHEFEGILFNSLEVFESTFEESEFINKEELESIFRDFPNPEMINNSPENAPSKRLIKLIVGYNKIVYGSILAENIGLERLRAKSPRFNEWISKLEEI